jgi:hypothetical protein
MESSHALLIRIDYVGIVCYFTNYSNIVKCYSKISNVFNTIFNMALSINRVLF